MKRKLGFTLIELLVVIIILAIVALIAVPIILDVVEDAKKSAGLSETELILSGINNYCAAASMKAQLNNDESLDICVDGVAIDEVSKMVNLGNAKVTKVTYTNGKVTELIVESNGYEYELQPDNTFTINGEVIKEKDETTPTIVAKQETITIAKGSNNIIKDYFTVTFGNTGGEVTCDYTNTSELTESKKVTCVAKGNNGKEASANIEIVLEIKNIYTDNSGANEPDLLNNMIPVRYDGKNWIYADTTIKSSGTLSDLWYNYDEKMWANAVVLNSGVTKNVNDMILESEIALWYVWIPRYTYTIFNGNNSAVSIQSIEIKFENGTDSNGTILCKEGITFSVDSTSSERCTDSTNGSIINGRSTYTHPAFTFDTQELTGIWVGKFENSTTDTTCLNSTIESSATTNCNKMLPVKIGPNLDAWRYVSISNQFNSILTISDTNAISDGDSHMMKNMEWGAVAYLSNSKYGRCTGTTCEEITMNNVRKNETTYNS